MPTSMVEMWASSRPADSSISTTLQRHTHRLRLLPTATTTRDGPSSTILTTSPGPSLRLSPPVLTTLSSISCRTTVRKCLAEHWIARRSRASSLLRVNLVASVSPFRKHIFCFEQLLTALQYVFPYHNRTSEVLALVRSLLWLVANIF